MKTRVCVIVILITVLAMALGYLGGSLVSAKTQPSLMEPNAPALTQAQWAALQAVSSLLLLESDGDTTAYLPLVLKR